VNGTPEIALNLRNSRLMDLRWPGRFRHSGGARRADAGLPASGQLWARATFTPTGCVF